MYLKDKNILFIHIPKTAGGTITKQLERNSNGNILYGHFNLISWKNIENINIDSTYIFSIVRNPWERMVSLYFWTREYINGKKNPSHQENHKSYYSDDNNINDNFNLWLKWVYDNKDNLKKIKLITINKNYIMNVFEGQFCNQINYLQDKNDNINNNIKIFTTDMLSDTFLDNLFKNELKCNNYNFTKNNNIHKTNHCHYSKYYNDESIQLIENYFSKDIQMFNFKFETI